MTPGYLIGTFDVLSIRDLDLIAAARTRCEELVVGLFTDEQLLASTGQNPVTPFVDRAALVSRLRGISRVVGHRTEEQADRLVLVGSHDADHLDPTTVEVITAGRDTRSSIVRAARHGSNRSEVNS